MSVKAYIPICWLLVLLSSPIASGQTPLEQSVTVSYDETPLQQVLFDLQTRYQIPFSYSSNLVQLDVPIRADYQSTVLRVVLDDVVGQADIRYAEIAGTIVLRDAPPQGRLSRQPSGQRSVPKEPEIRFSGTPPWKEAGLLLEPVPIWSATSVRPLPRPVWHPRPRWRLLDSVHFAGQRGPLVLQASIVPYLGNYLEYSDQVVANASFNLLWGVTGGIVGAEFGLGVNVTKGQMQGAQFSGLINVVTGPVYGVQVAGGMNVAEDRTAGVQLAGVGNYSRLHDGVQLAGVANITAWRTTGLQVAGLLNVAGGRRSAVAQLASLINITGGSARWQAASLLNVADEVRGGQVGLLNVGGEVTGFQLGLINISDTISGPSVGLLNFVRRGYNRFDLSSSEVFWTQTGVALGSPHFYNLFQLGYRGTDGRANASWALGYGLGTRVGLSQRWQTKLEVFAWHVNEEESWTRRMNWLLQGRLLFEKHSGILRHWYFGPVLNLSVSRLRAGENGVLGSRLAPYDLLEQLPHHNTNYKAWIGLQAGFRF